MKLSKGFKTIEMQEPVGDYMGLFGKRENGQ